MRKSLKAYLFDVLREVVSTRLLPCVNGSSPVKFTLCGLTLPRGGLAGPTYLYPRDKYSNRDQLIWRQCSRHCGCSNDNITSLHRDFRASRYRALGSLSKCPRVPCPARLPSRAFFKINLGTCGSKGSLWIFSSIIRRQTRKGYLSPSWCVSAHC